jgi:hypothetical protein
MSAPAVRASMKDLVPDLAIVPRLFTKSDIKEHRKKSVTRSSYISFFTVLMSNEQ